MDAEAIDSEAADPGTVDAGGSGATWLTRVEADRTARWAMWVAWPLGVLTIVVIGRDQWFARDDWAFIFTRQRMREVGGLDEMLLAPQDGHWMTWPILVFRVAARRVRHRLVPAVPGRAVGDACRRGRAGAGVDGAARRVGLDDRR